MNDFLVRYELLHGRQEGMSEMPGDMSKVLDGMSDQHDQMSEVDDMSVVDDMSEGDGEMSGVPDDEFCENESQQYESETSENSILQNEEELHSSHLQDDFDAANNAESEHSIANKLGNWMISSHISQENMKNLLALLKSYIPDLPKDPRTLIKIDISQSYQIAEGCEYVFLGIRRNLEAIAEAGVLDINYRIYVNIDGLPLFRSSLNGFWPILGKTLHSNPFLIAVTYGKNKPPVSFLDDTINELNTLINDPFVCNGKVYNLCPKNIIIICDSPAKSFVRQTKSHGGFFPCDVCTIEGSHDGTRMCYKELNSRKRQHSLFHSEDSAYKEHKVGDSPFLRIEGLDFTTQFPRDPMHLLYLGIMKKLINIWVKDRSASNKKAKLSGLQLRNLSDKLDLMQGFIPTIFSRRPRPLKELDRWKASEFRQFLLYTGPILLKDLVNGEVYQHFLLLHCAIRILCATSDANATKTADSLLQQFVVDSIPLYGEKFSVFNVHNLLHLSTDCNRFGHLETFSAFPFENFLFKLKNCVHNAKAPIKQIQRFANKLSPLPAVKEKNPYKINYKPRIQNSIYSSNGKPIKVKQISVIDGLLVARGQLFELQNDLFNDPIASSTIGLGVFRLSDQEHNFTVDDSDIKFISVPFKQNYVIVQLLSETHKSYHLRE